MPSLIQKLAVASELRTGLSHITTTMSTIAAEKNLRGQPKGLAPHFTIPVSGRYEPVAGGVLPSGAVAGPLCSIMLASISDEALTPCKLWRALLCGCRVDGALVFLCFTAQFPPLLI